ncbi:MAG: DUF445 family protein [Candidatus Eisenbacteria bacterium]|uniref:DUF445 family protein n=1 Tax=Eiseniibacteriota bacterium TaxID=2212470 RepID=A0A956NE27_UNCEI|nr:DUF445 family protein [Candidatus Eisenbacteria bacterium]MCB9463878.1 DUF445 family protein [Candidatus Eisenbacteria bacterium]
MDPRFLVFPVVGAIIGAVTNQIAIKMLFRPYQPVYLGSWRLPLTPGVIPAQRGTIAKNIAETFEAQLFSGDEIHRFLTGPKAREAVEGKVDEMITGLGPIGAMARGFQPTIVEKLLVGMEELADEAIAHGGEFDIGKRIEDKINAMDIRELERLVLGFSSKQFRHITFFGGVLGFAIGIVQAILAAVL